MSYPNEDCMLCPAWINHKPADGMDRRALCDEYCQNCYKFQVQTFVRHIPTQCCYPLEQDGTVNICGVIITPKIGDGFWEYSEGYIEKKIVPVDPIEAARRIQEERERNGIR